MRLLGSESLLFLALGVTALAVASASCAKGTVVGLGGQTTSTIKTVTSSTGGGGTGGTGGGVTDGGSDAPVACLHKSDCAAVIDACNDASCVDNVCVQAPTNEGGNCDDGLFCTQDDTCTMGVCSGSPTTCPGSDACHVGVCDEPTKTCSSSPGNDGFSCFPTDMCFSSGFCQSGTCVGEVPEDCSFLNDECNTGVCMSGMGCVKMPENGNPCFDGSFCSVNKTCVNGACAGGTPVACAPSTTQCSVNTCVEGVHPCEAGPAPDGTGCSTMNPCLTQEACTGGVCVGGVPANEGMACASAAACTSTPKCTSGVCTGAPITACINNDACCPTGCTASNDNDCNCNLNLALSAIGLTSGGGAPPCCGPSDMNDGVGKSNCSGYSWLGNSSSPAGAYWELDWPSPVTIASFYVEAPDINGITCGVSFGRNIAGAQVQTWNGSTWVTATSFSGQSGDVQINLPAPVVTTKLRLYNVTAGSLNSIMFEWHVYSGVSCIPAAD